MILPFSIKLNGKPTYFPEKIVTGLEHNKIITFDEAEHLFDVKIVHHKSKKGVVANTRIKLDGTIDHKPKLHTIREDVKERWQVGKKIDFFINCRQKDMFRFAPVLPVVSVQNIDIKHHLDYVTIFIDEMVYELEKDELLQKIKSTDDVIKTLAENDGFDTIEGFLAYFDKDFKGKIIHWTDLKY